MRIQTTNIIFILKRSRRLSISQRFYNIDISRFTKKKIWNNTTIKLNNKNKLLEIKIAKVKNIFIDNIKVMFSVLSNYVKIFFNYYSTYSIFSINQITKNICRDVEGIEYIEKSFAKKERISQGSLLSKYKAKYLFNFYYKPIFQ